MKMRQTIYNTWMAALFVLAGSLTTGCSDDPEPEDTRSLLKISSMTRAGGGEDLPAGTTIQMLLVIPGEDTDGDLSGTVAYRGNNSWTSDVYIQAGETYQVYGFMPAGIATSSSVTGAAKNVLAMEGFSPLSREDVCLVIGVKDGDAEGDVVPGQYTYETGLDGNNSIHLLMQHIYSDVHFKMMISEDYDRLRTVKVKELKLKVNIPSKDGKMKAQATLTNSRTAPINPFTIGPVEGGEQKEPEMMLFTSDEGVRLTTDGFIEVDGYFAAGYSENISLVSRYDVYDKAGNLLGERTAENKLTYVIGGILAGHRKEVTLTVNPTYLYQLSEPDLDNPTVTIEN